MRADDLVARRIHRALPPTRGVVVREPLRGVVRRLLGHVRELVARLDPEM